VHKDYSYNGYRQEVNMPCIENNVLRNPETEIVNQRLAEVST